MSSAIYRVPAAMQHAEIEIKKSRFIAVAGHVLQRDQALRFLAQVKQDYPDARHYCWAYVLGNPYAASSAAMNDDGEPSGTAGRPILGVMQHKKIGNIMLVVVRYFGGIKLGAGGLTRAYAAATEALLSNLQTQEFVPSLTRLVCLAFAQEHGFRHWATQHNVNLLQSEWRDNQLQLTVELPESILPILLSWAELQRMQVMELD